MNWVAVVVALWVAGAAAPGQAPSVVAISSKVLVKDVVRVGVNVDNPGSGRVWLKKPVQVNWEGVAYRQCHFGPFADEHGAATWSPCRKAIGIGS